MTTIFLLPVSSLLFLLSFSPPRQREKPNLCEYQQEYNTRFSLSHAGKTFLYLLSSCLTLLPTGYLKEYNNIKYQQKVTSIQNNVKLNMVEENGEERIYADEDCLGEHDEDYEECKDCDEIESCKEQKSYKEEIEKTPFDIYSFLFALGIIYTFTGDLLRSVGVAVFFSWGYNSVSGKNPYPNIMKWGVVLIILFNTALFSWGYYEGSLPPGESNVIGLFFIDSSENDIDGTVYLDNVEIGKTLDGFEPIMRSYFEEGYTHVLRFQPDDDDGEYCEWEFSKEDLVENSFLLECP